AAAKVVEDAGGFGYGLAGLGIGDEKGGADLGANAAGKVEVQALEGLVGTDDPAAGFLQVFLQLEGISLNRYINVSNCDTAGKIANGATDEKDCKPMRTGDIADAFERLPLGWGEPRLQEVDVIGHRFRLNSRTCCVTGKSRSVSYLEDFVARSQHLIVQQIGQCGEFSISEVLRMVRVGGFRRKARNIPQGLKPHCDYEPVRHGDLGLKPKATSRAPTKWSCTRQGDDVRARESGQEPWPEETQRMVSGS